MAFRNSLYCDNLEEVKKCIVQCHNMVCHVMNADENQWDSEYIVVSHIVCEYCSMCEAQGDMRSREIKNVPDYKEVVWL